MLTLAERLASAGQAVAAAQERVDAIGARLQEIDREIARLLRSIEVASHLMLPMLRKQLALARQERRSVGGQLAEANDELDRAKQALATVQAEQRRLDELQELLAPLPATNHPIALLPVHVETRFVQRGDRHQLLVRIYPDDIHVDGHEPELTGEEIRWGRHFWEQRWRAADDEARRQGVWAQLANRFGPERASWIRLALTPENPDQQPRTPLDEDEPLPNPPDFPAVDTRVDTWTRALHTDVLPDRWVVMAYRDDRRVLLEWGETVPDRLATSPAPDTPLGQRAAAGNDESLRLDAASSWLIDFDQAVKVGMGLRLPLTAEDAERGFDQLIAFGLKASLDPVASAHRLQQLLDAQRYTDGVAFIPQATPSNNTPEVSSGYARRGRSQTTTFPQVNTVVLDGNGPMTARALGLAPEALQDVEGAWLREGTDARHMNTALWPASVGYFVEQWLSNVVDEAQLERLRLHFITHVRARGPLPVLRVGAQPYGLLPVMSLDGVQEIGGEPVFAALLQAMRRQWQQAVGLVPLVTDTTGGDVAERLLTILEQSANTVTFQARLMFDRLLFGTARIPFTQGDAPTAFRQRANLLRELLPKEVLARNPRLLEIAQASKAFALKAPLVQADGPEDDPGLDPNYIRWMAEATVTELLSEDMSRLSLELSGPPDTLLYLLLRHATLLSFSLAAFRILVDEGLEQGPFYREPALVDLLPDSQAGGSQAERTRTLLRLLEQTVPQVSPQPLGQVIHQLDQTDHLAAIVVQDHRDSLMHLAGLPVDALEQLLRETLDIGSYRLDAWITSLASRRLDALREREPRGIHLGGFGWLENVRPARARVPVSQPPPGEAGSPLLMDEANAGFVPAPSLVHAATAALLRSGYLSQIGEDQSRPLAIDLSSERVRLAQWLLAGIRQGTALEALLGYRLERGLHDRRLDRFIVPLRKLAPLGQAGSDGLTLLRMFQAGELPFGAQGLPARNSTNGRALVTELEALANLVDAVGDALTAESVYQIVLGNPERAAAAVDALAPDEIPPPDLEIAHTPRSGVGATHRLLVLFGGSAEPPVDWPTNTHQQRAAAEPHLNAWAARLLGDPNRIRCRAAYLDPATGAVLLERTVRLRELALSPLDLLALAAQPAELEAHLRFHLLVTAPPVVVNAAEVSLLLDFERGEDWPLEDISLAECLEVASAVSELLTNARPVDGRDLDVPENNPAPGIDVAELRRRADQAVMALRAAGQALRLAQQDPTDLGPLREALMRLACQGVPGSVPAAPLGEDESTRQVLLAQARTVEQVVTKRVKRLDLAEASFDLDLADPSLARDHELFRLQTALGGSLPVLPRFQAGNAAALGQAFANQALVPDDQPLAVLMWFQRMARVRPGAARLQTVRLYASALDPINPLSLTAGQLPHDPDEPWIALPGDQPFPPGRLSLVAHLPEPFDASLPLAGVLVDNWTETIPNATEIAGIAFNYDQPDAHPPHTVLLAVTPEGRTVWDVEALADTILDTLALARLRAVDPAVLINDNAYTFLLPALAFALNVEDDTVSTDFKRFQGTP